SAGPVSGLGGAGPVAGRAFLMVSQSTFRENQALGGVGGPVAATNSEGNGGALDNAGWYVLVLTDTTFAANQATGGAGRPGRGGGNGQGGALLGPEDFDPRRNPVNA